MNFDADNIPDEENDDPQEQEDEYRAAHWTAWIRTQLEGEREVRLVVNDMVGAGWPREDAELAVEGARQQRLVDLHAAADATAEFQRLRRNAIRTTLLGLLILSAGVMVTAKTYYAASETGGVYLIAWGAVVVGLVRFVTGLMTVIRPMPTRLDGRRVPGRVIGRYTPGAKY